MAVEPRAGHELCYECDGEQRCWSCRGLSVRKDGSRCNTCAGRGQCIVCHGSGELVEGTRAALERAPE